MDFTQWNITAAWISMLLGCTSGALMGLRFHRSDWRGGYWSFERRLIRLGHIAFFGLAFVNFAFVETVQGGYVSGSHLITASYALITGMFTMPLFCFLTARNRNYRFGFFLPTGSVAWGIISVIAALPLFQ